ncbi:MAG TPA: DNA replication/repair protein RecF [Longimicrobiaceae bacterium]|nr:DNA replication/repair protein RecF [Longimicrobiaceae bacterium]
MPHLSRLRLRNFRNFTDQILDFPAGGVAIIGDNGQGKTNLLEAIYYLEILRSFRGAPDEQLVRFGEEVFRLDGRVTSQGAHDQDIGAAFDRTSRRKKVTLGGTEPPRIGDALGTLGAVIFSPTDVAIVSGSPGMRRRYLDIALSLTRPGYLQALQRYRQVLTQRNALLRQDSPRAVVAAFNGGLVDAGSRVMATRARWIHEFAESFARHVAAVSGGATAVMEYDPSVKMSDAGSSNHDEEAIAREFTRELSRVAEREERQGNTVVGPHRDDLRIRGVGGGGESVDLRAYGSGGQQRTAAVALRMIEAEALKEARGRQPVVLLDDVFAELDPGRSSRILQWVDEVEVGQVILTAPKPTDFDVKGGSLPRWTIRDGVVDEL